MFVTEPIEEGISALNSENFRETLTKIEETAKIEEFKIN